MSQDTVNMRNPDHSEVRSMMHAAQIARRTRMIRDMLRQKPVDLTQDSALYLSFNSENMSMDEFLKHSSKYCTDAALAAKERRSADSKDHNPKSKAKWRILGYIPSKVYFSRSELWNNKAGVKKFFNDNPKFRISDQRV